MLAKESESENWEEKIDAMVEFASHLPGGDLSWVRLALEVVSSTVEPMSIPVHMQLFEVSEFVEGMVLKIVTLDLLILSRLWLVLEPRLVRNSRALVVSRLHLSRGQETRVERGSPQ